MAEHEEEVHIDLESDANVMRAEMTVSTSSGEEHVEGMTATQRQALLLKEEGNELYRNEEYQLAIDKFSEGISLDRNKALFCNRSLSHAALGEWQASIDDANAALELDPKYAKAHFRLVKAFMELRAHRECRQYLLRALKECGETADFKQLEIELKKKTGMPVRPG